MTDSAKGTIEEKAPASADVRIDETEPALEEVGGGFDWRPGVAVVHPLREPRPAAPILAE